MENFAEGVTWFPTEQMGSALMDRHIGGDLKKNGEKYLKRRG